MNAARADANELMESRSLDIEALYRSLTLEERVASLRGTNSGQGASTFWAVPEDARARLQRWKSQSPFSTSPTIFEQRIIADGISESMLLYLLGETSATLAERFPVAPPWVQTLTRLYSGITGPQVVHVPPTQLRGGPEIAGFLNLAWPLIIEAQDRLDQCLEMLKRKYSELPFDTTVRDLLFAQIPSQLLMRMSRTLVLELNVARLSGHLRGETPEERFQDFIAQLGDLRVAGALWEEYPVLARQLVVFLDQWVAFSSEFLTHLCEDWDEIRAAFGQGDSIGPLTAVVGGAGDLHRRGRSVLLLRFASGMGLVYKPRSLRVDLHFQELLQWLNEHGTQPAFRTLRLLERGAHGWVEFAAAESCASVAEIERFYQRQGAYLALLYALRATDFHFENLIACGEHPVLVDLESLFHPPFNEVAAKDTDFLASSLMARSVMRIGLLPQLTWSRDVKDAIDISGLASVDGQLTPHGVASWEEPGTDQMRFTRQRLPIPGQQNRPTLNGEEVSLLNHTEDILAGFTQLYRLLVRHRDALLSADGPIARFAEDEVRVLVRPTRIYGQLLAESFHPDLLRDGLDRDRFFDHLWVGVESRPYLAQVIPAERKDLQAGDIPLFWTHPASPDLFTSTNQRIINFFPKAGIKVVDQLVRELGEQDLMQQMWFIRASLATLAQDTARAQWQSYHPLAPQAAVTPHALLSAARAVGDRLEQLTLSSSDGATWIGLTLVDGRRWALLPLGADLYSGLPGVALFLAYLGALTGESKYTALAHKAVTSFRRLVARSRAQITALGAFSGWGGLIYVMAHLAALWEDDDLLGEAEQAADLIPELAVQDERLDIIGGSAGCIGGLLSLYRLRPSRRVARAVEHCADQLIGRAAAAEHGLAWTTPVAAKAPLCGFSHGAAGMAWALLEGAAMLGEERFRQGAISAITYERSRFSAAVGNWPDLRILDNEAQAAQHYQENYLITWCHGAPGIGLARLQALQHLDDPDLLMEVDVAINTTLAHGFGFNHSLCHGDLGNLELLLQARERLSDPRCELEVPRLTSIVLTSIEQRGWLCGIPLGVESPGLMTGLAGIGYGLLRLAAPQEVPSVLTLAPPFA